MYGALNLITENPAVPAVPAKHTKIFFFVPVVFTIAAVEHAKSQFGTDGGNGMFDMCCSHFK